jgi:membrane-associated protease RseP (regulator of RpoE activity)
MINLDMVGRLSNKDKNLEINGVGSSPSFDTILDAVSLNDLRIKKGLSGIGPSDHSSFYLKNIPVLHFFTGQHEDYHKPTDDAEKVNIDGMQKVCEYILLTIQEIEKRDKLSFTKTKQDSSAAPRYKISLGIIPDYMYDGDGLRIDGVSDGRPAQKAGLQKGDIVLQLGENKVGDMSGYMKALSEFKKGDETTVIIKRGKEMMSFKVIF